MGGPPRIGVVKPPKKTPMFNRVWNHDVHHPFWVPLFWETSIFGIEASIFVDVNKFKAHPFMHP